MMENYDQCSHDVTFQHGSRCKRTRYYLNGILHRVDGPAEIVYYKTGQTWAEYYYIHGKEHRIDGPARISYYRNGRIKDIGYLINGHLHKTDGPAIIRYGRHGGVKIEYFYQKGACHNLRKFVANMRKSSNKTQTFMDVLQIAPDRYFAATVLAEMFRNDIDPNVLNNLSMFL